MLSQLSKNLCSAGAALSFACVCQQYLQQTQAPQLFIAAIGTSLLPAGRLSLQQDISLSHQPPLGGWSLSLGNNTSATM